jgi:phospholipid transport system substrate-binding protein
MRRTIRTLARVLRTLPPSLAVLAGYCVLLAAWESQWRHRRLPRSLMPGLLALLCGLALVPAAAPAHAAASAPASAQVRSLSDALLAAMKAGPSVPAAARYRKLEPVIDRVFALPFMTRLSVGPAWTSFPPQQQSALIAAFSRYTIANYAHNFRDFSGQRFEVNDGVITRGKDEVVRSSLTSPGGSPTSLLYRMRDVDGSWKIVDVYYNGISQLTLHRVQFAAAIASGGAPALISYLDKVSDGFLK